MFDGNAFYVSRAATGIYLILKTTIQNPEKKTVLIPANICYAAVLPIVYCGLKVRFCDVDSVTGNVTYKSFVEKCSDDVAAAIVPHMYGNPVDDLHDISLYCRKKCILLIEDCASAMGSKSEKYKLGSQGDFTVYSMGYSKTVDLGYGGIIVSELDLKAIENEERSLSLYNENANELAFFSKIYRDLRNDNNNTKLRRKIYSALPGVVKDELLCRINDKQKEYLKNGLKSLESVIQNRRYSQSLYESQLPDLKENIYHFSDGSVPWRFCMLLDKKIKKQIISECLKNNLPISDWYPVVAPVFGDYSEYPGAKAHEEHILNFPLPNSEKQINDICRIINSTVNKRI
ncbi:MAG: DegT/DnrJ/EryC1/StrS family aminotransferase [Clostridia bacterium]|nr:DegT/DnrJ/EryC1/StrS family aminotransferase [Clostridia bacterium]